MASNGLTNTATKGTCRICQRVRNTDKYLKAVGEVRHGFATGHIWECKDTMECDKTAAEKLVNEKYAHQHGIIKKTMEKGRYREYMLKR